MKKFWKILAALIAVAILAGTFWFLYQNSKPKEVTYTVVKVDSGTIEKTSVISGKVEPRTQIDVKPQISGIISEIMLEPGAVVKKGDVIAKIQVVPDAAQVSNAENRVTLAKMSLEQAQREFERMTKLKDQQFVSGEEWEQSHLAYNKAKEEYSAALDNLNIVREGVSQKYASQSNTLVRSTIDGVILDIPVKRGNSVIMANTFNDGTTVATVADMNDLIFRGKIDETEIGRVHNGMKLTVQVGALSEVNLDAYLEYISPKSNEDNGAITFEIKAAIEMKPGITLRAGYSANATIALEKAEGVLTLPEYAISYEADSTFVYVAQDSLQNKVFTRTPVQTGLSDGINVEIVQGVKKGTFVRGRGL